MAKISARTKEEAITYARRFNREQRKAGNKDRYQVSTIKYLKKNKYQKGIKIYSVRKKGHQVFSRTRY